jgi:hypothetical protein
LIVWQVIVVKSWAWFSLLLFSECNYPRSRWYKVHIILWRVWWPWRFDLHFWSCYNKSKHFTHDIDTVLGYCGYNLNYAKEYLRWDKHFMCWSCDYCSMKCCDLWEKKSKQSSDLLLTEDGCMPSLCAVYHFFSVIPMDIQLA